ncbi:MAG: ATP-binding protein [Truepera sp.]|nr:ATP-binding protein [Truepera sp.]
MSDSVEIGRVLGTEPATPLDFWVALDKDQVVQLDEVVALERELPNSSVVRIYGVVTELRAMHEGARFDSDVFLIKAGVIPAEVTEIAKVQVTRFEPEFFVPPLPGQAVRRARGYERDEALFFDGMTSRLPAGLSREGEPVYVNFEFVDGTRGAHVNISGVSGVATKTTYATFLLHSIFTSGAMGSEAVNAKALIFNVKGEDLMFLDHKNLSLEDDEANRYTSLGLEASRFQSAEFWAPPRKGDSRAVPDTGSRQGGVNSYFWTLQEFCNDELLPYLFTDAQDDRQQYTIIVHNVTARLKREAEPLDEGGVKISGDRARTLGDLFDIIADRLDDEATSYDWAGRAVGGGTVGAFIRRLYGARSHVEHLIRGDIPKASDHKIRRQEQVTVVDIHNLNDRAKRFVVGVTLHKAFEEKERTGQSRPLLFVMLDELNKYAPREGFSPIKEILLDVAERGRSLGMILIGAQQTASEVERRIIANSSIRVVGRLDSAEAGRDEYGFLPTEQRQRATIMKPGTMILAQPELPIPLVVEFPFPAWATRPDEAGAVSGDPGDDEDPFKGLELGRADK